MNIILNEDLRVPIFTNKIVKKFSNSSIVKVNKRTRFDDLKRTLSYRPLFNKSYLILVSKNTEPTVLEYCLTLKDEVVVVYCDSNSKNIYYNKAKKFSTTKIVDVTRMDESGTIDYIKSRLTISDDNAKKLMNKCNKFMPFIEENVISLEVLGCTITSKEIDKYVSKYSNITVYSLFYSILGIKSINSKDLVYFLYSFRRAFDYLHKTLLTLFKITIRIYSDIESGDLGCDNIKQYHTEKELKDVSVYFVKQIVEESHKSLNLRDILVLEYAVKESKNILELLNLVKGEL